MTSSAQTVLVVDDNELIRSLASQMLAEAGFVPFSAPGGAEAIELLDSHVFDLIIVDFVMPEMLGDELIRRVRGHRNPAIRAIPVLGLSGSHQEADALFARAGANACVRKPLQDESLLDAVGRVLQVVCRRSERLPRRWMS